MKELHFLERMRETTPLLTPSRTPVLNSIRDDENITKQKDNIKENREINSLENRKQIKIGFLFLSLLIIYGYLFVFLAYH